MPSPEANAAVKSWLKSGPGAEDGMGVSNPDDAFEPERRGGADIEWGARLSPRKQQRLMEGTAATDKAKEAKAKTGKGTKKPPAPHEVGPGGCCSPRHRVPFNSRDEGSECVG